MFNIFKKKVKTEHIDYSPSKTQLRHYNAIAKERLLSGWESSPIPGNQVIRQSLTQIRARSREQARNNDYVKQYIRTLRNNVVGSVGVKIQTQAKRADNPKVLDAAANSAIDSAYAEFGASIDTTGRITRIANYGLILSSLVTEGEYIAIKRMGKGYGKYGYQLELVDPELLDVERNATLSNGNQIRMGIEYDSRNRAVNYYFKIFRPELNGYSGHEWRVIPADMVIHLFYPEFVGQERGMPWLATSLFTLKTLDAYDEAAITAARLGASKMGFFGNDGDGTYTGDEDYSEEGGEGATITEAAPGTFENIGNNKFYEFNPTYPHEQYPHFKKAGIRRFSSGLGAQYETIANDREGVNYTSIRHGTMEDRETWKTIQEFLISQFVKEDRETWLSHALMSRQIKIGLTPLSRPPEDYMPARYQARRWDWIDPSKDITAKQKERELLTKSVSEIIMESGREPEDVFQQIAEDNRRMSELGINPSEIIEDFGEKRK